MSDAVLFSRGNDESEAADLWDDSELIRLWNAQLEIQKSQQAAQTSATAMSKKKNDNNNNNNNDARVDRILNDIPSNRSEDGSAEEEEDDEEEEDEEEGETTGDQKRGTAGKAATGGEEPYRGTLFSFVKGRQTSSPSEQQQQKQQNKDSERITGDNTNANYKRGRTSSDSSDDGNNQKRKNNKKNNNTNNHMDRNDIGGTAFRSTYSSSSSCAHLIPGLDELPLDHQRIATVFFLAGLEAGKTIGKLSIGSHTSR